MALNEVQATKVVTGKVRFSYLQVWEPKSIDGIGDAKYSVSLLIPKSDVATINKIKAAIEAALKAGLAKLGGKIPPVYKNPLRDGDVERPDDETYKGCYFVNASCKTAPGVVDKHRNPILDQSELYSGCFGVASVNFYVFNTSGNKGVACGLNNLMKLADGESLGGRSTAESDFAGIDIADDEDDMLN